MKHLKLLLGLTIPGVILMGSLGASTAYATELTCPGWVMCPPGTIIHAESEEPTVIHPPIGSIVCNQGTFEGVTTNTGSSTETIKGHITSHVKQSCNASVSILKKGSFEIHTDPTDPEGKGLGAGIFTSSGTEITIQFSGFHCVFTTNNTSLGTITGSTFRSQNTATLDINGQLPRTGGSSGVFCGSTAQVTGAYSITKPDWLDVDHVLL